MIRVNGLGRVLFLIGIAAATGHPQAPASDYVAPEQAVPRGRAPKMQVALLNPSLNPRESAKQYAVIFYQGDEAFSSGVSVPFLIVAFFAALALAAVVFSVDLVPSPVSRRLEISFWARLFNSFDLAQSHKRFLNCCFLLLQLNDDAFYVRH
jgi:hypothetical protein